MKLTYIHLTDFRNYSKKSLEFSPEITLIVGPNASGKTNVLEAIYALATGDSWRTETAKDMIRFGAEVAHVVGDGLHLILTPGFVAGKRSAASLYKVDEVPRRRTDFVGRLKVVLFEPESLEIVIGDPVERRRFLDGVLLQTDREYARSLGIYARALRTRNRLLQAIRDGKARVESLEYWEREMIKHGMVIQEKRRQMVEWLDGQMVEISIKYDASVMSEERLEQYREREIAAGFTLIGPQRDDFGISSIGGGSEARIGKRQTSSVADDSSQPTHETSLANAAASHFPLSAFGSRGEQRMAVLRLKLLTAEWIEKETGDSPIILLDDIFSELDREHEEIVGELVRGRQAIVTATEIPKDYKENATKIIELS